MAIYFCREFIRDLAQHPDAHFASKVMSKVCNADGEFEPAGNDHRYKGIEGAFIRWVTEKPNYYRAIYIRRGADVYWYRAGRHDVEDRLQPPSQPLEGTAIGSTPDGTDLVASHRNPRYTKSIRPRFLREVIASRFLVPHRQLMLVSPRLSATMISPVGLVGRLIERVQGLGGSTTVITRPPPQRDVSAYRWLASRGVDLLLHERVNARLYLFEVDSEKLDPEIAHVRSIAIVGSAELNEKGLNFQLPDGQTADEELCYEIADNDIEGAMEFCIELTDGTVDFDTYIARGSN